MTNKTLVYIIAGIVVLVAVVVLFAQRGENRLEPLDPRENEQSTNNESNNSGNNQNTNNTSTPMTTEKQRVEMQVKGFGKIVLELDPVAAPKTVENFVKLTSEGFYNNLTLHRVAQGFVVQGGDPKGDGTGGPGYTVPAEIKLTHKRGSIAMARLGDPVNPKRESSGSQFYIALEDLPMLDGAYTVFGQVVEGMDVVDKIGAVPITPQNGPTDGAPKEPVVIESVKIIK